jgi:adenylyl-sulfate kinase
MRYSPLVVWFTGLSGSGKSTLAKSVYDELVRLQVKVYLLDGDKLREGLNKNLGFSDADRKENIRRAGEVAKLFFDEGYVVLCTFISPFRSDRLSVRNLFPESAFAEVYVNAPFEICEQRDVKGLYRKARKGDIQQFTGITSGYEYPENPDLEIRTDQLTVQESMNKVLAFLLPHIQAPK